MTTDAQLPPLPELPPELATAIARTVTYASDDESVTVVAQGDMTLARADVQVFSQTEVTEVGAQLTSACAAALDDVQQWTTAALLSSGLLDEESEGMLTGAVPEGELPPPVVVTDGVVTVIMGPDMRLASITLDHLEDPPAIGPSVVRAVNKALVLARGGVEDDLEATADARIAELDAELDRLHSSLDGVGRRLDELERSLDA